MYEPADPCARTETAAPRFRCAVQVVKRRLLGDAHDPLQLQLDLMWEALEARHIDLTGKLARGTIRNWWDGSVSRANIQSSQALDEAASRAITFTRHSDGQEIAPEPDYFSSLMRGGLLRALCASTTAEQDEQHLWSVASGYVPTSSLHLQFDALDAAILDFGWAGRSWQELKGVAAHRVLHALHLRWSPRWARAYEQLSSPQRSRWLAATAAEREAMAAASRHHPVVTAHLERQRTRGGAPNWSRIPVGLDAQPGLALKTMVALAADEAFWEEDRLQAWSWDLATAILATGAALWSDARASFWGPVSDTVVIWTTLMKWWFLPEGEPQASDLDAACVAAGLPLDGPAQRVLLRAWISYRQELHALGLRAEVLGELARRCERTQHPLRVQGHNQVESP